MMYDNAVDQIKGLKTPKNDAELPLHLAKVTSLSNGRAYVKFYGEGSPSSKLYPYIEGYKPAVGDDVLMFRQGSTYIIAGKISKNNIIDNYHLRKSDADELYLTQEEADELYDPLGATDIVYVLRRKKDSWYFAIDNNGRLYGNNQDSNNVVFVSIGDASNPMEKIFTKELALTNGGNMIPYQNNSSDIGSTTRLFKAGYFNKLGDPASQTAVQTLNVKDSNVYGNILPATNNSSNIGSSSSKQFNNVYAKQFYQNGTAISTSDRRKKKSIKDITKKYVDFFRKLRPRTFLFKKGESGRTHCGFIAQEVEEAASECGIDSKELAFLCIDKDGGYGLRYEELIAIQTKIIQDLLSRVEALEDRVNGGKANDK